MKKTLIIAFVLCSFMFSCKDITSEKSMTKETMIINLLNDKDYLTLKKAEDDFFHASKQSVQASDKIDWSVLKKAMPRSKQEYILQCKNAGMKNPEAYVNAKIQMMTAMANIRKNHPELQQLSYDERFTIFKQADLKIAEMKNANNGIHVK